jgi:hypothetical protein
MILAGEKEKNKKNPMEALVLFHDTTNFVVVGKPVGSGLMV